METLEQGYIEYLKYKRYTERTIKNKLGHLKHFTDWLQQEHLELIGCTYSDIMSFVKQMQRDGRSIASQNLHLRAIRQLYEGLILNEKTNYNPIANLRVRGDIERIPHNLLSPEQLQAIYDSYRPTTDYQLRNKVILGLYINQALIRTELNRLEVRDINLTKGIVHIRKNIKLAERILPLAAHQVLMLQEYISKIRPLLLKQSDFEKGDRLFFTYANGQTINEALKKLLQIIRKRHPEIKNLQQIRSSVLATWIKEKPIREAQYLAGHSNIKSTQRYRDVNMQDLQASLNEYHPLGNVASAKLSR
jgi:integrase/recombinase XerD